MNTLQNYEKPLAAPEWFSPCPYCATRLEGPGPVVCSGCGNPVALGARSLAIAVWVDEPIWKQQEFALMRKPMTRAGLARAEFQVRKAA